MQHVAKGEVIRRVLRSEICTVCPHRPAGSEDLGPSVPRSCEAGCAIMSNAEELLRIAKQTEGQVCAPFEREIQDQICAYCTLSESAGDYCADGMARTCVLSSHAREALNVLERWMQRDRQRRRVAGRLRRQQRRLAAVAD